MYKICVFVGTTEGRKLIEFLSTQPVTVTACAATNYGGNMLTPSENLTISTRRLTSEEVETMLREGGFDLVIDATHPYANRITENLYAACYSTETDYLRLLRVSGDMPEDAVFVKDAAEAAHYLNAVEGNILLTTGSKDLNQFATMQDFALRTYARVLPMEDSLKACYSAGLKTTHIFAMQGPFSEEMNMAILRAVSAKYLVTKDGGNAGGFEEKARAAKKTGVKFIVIGRPPQHDGLSFSQTLDYLCKRFEFQKKIPCITVVGIGPGDRLTMTREVLNAIEEADCLIGASRMLKAVALPGQAVFEAISPNAIVEYIKSHPQYDRFTIVMSGDVGFFSGTKKLLPLLADFEVRVLPGLSSLVYLCAKLKCSYEDVVSVSLHGREHDIVREVSCNSRVFALVGGENEMKRLCTALIHAGLGHVKMSIGEHLSYPEEKITIGQVQELAGGCYAALSVALIEHDHMRNIVTPGLPDTAFQRSEGKEGVIAMTKSEVRSVCLSKLQLTPNAVCWDVGAGTGTVAIEMALQASRGHIYAIERKDEAIELLQENCCRFGIKNLTAVLGIAPQACSELPPPTHGFIGGSSGNMREIISLLLEKNPRVRIVATAISLESVAELTACMKAFPFTETEVVAITVAKGQKVGSYHLMSGQNPIYIFTMQQSRGSRSGRDKT